MLLFSGSGLALSVIAYAMPPPPKWEALAVHRKFLVSPEALPLGELLSIAKLRGRACFSFSCPHSTTFFKKIQNSLDFIFLK